MAYVMSQKDYYFNLIQQRYAGTGAYIYSITIQGVASIPGSAPAGQFPVSFNYSLGVSVFNNVSQIVIPATQVWYVVDMYLNASPSVDGYVLFYKNGTKLMQQSPLLSSMVNTNPARSTIAPMRYEPHTILSAILNTIAANSSTSAVADTFYLSVVVVDYSYVTNAARVLL